MVSALRVKYTLPESTALRMGILPHGQAIGQLIAFIVQKQRQMSTPFRSTAAF
jgi:hypothetical protein